MEELSNLLINISKITFAKIINQFVIYFIFYILIIRWVSIEDFSTFLIYKNILAFFSVAMIISSPVIIIYYIQYFKNSNSNRNNIVWFFFKINLINFLIISILTITIFNLFNLNIGTFNYSNQFFLILILLISFFVSNHFLFIESIFYGEKDSTRIAIIELVLTLLIILFSITFVFFLKLGFIGIICTYLLSYSISMIISIFFLYKFYKKKHQDFNVTLDINLKKSIFKFGIPLFLNNIFYYFAFRFNSLLLYYKNPLDLIYYDLSINLIIFILLMLGANLYKSLFPYISGAYIEDNEKKLKSLFQVSLKLTTIIVSILIILYFFSPLIFRVFYPSYLNTILSEAFRLALIGGFFYALSQITGKFILAKKKSNIILFNQLTGAIVNFIVILLSFDYFNLYFALSGFISSLVIMALINYLYLLKISPFLLKDFKIFYIIISFFLSVILFHTMNIVFIKNDFFTGLIVLGIFILSLLIFKIITPHDLKTLFFLFKKIFCRKGDMWN